MAWQGGGSWRPRASWSFSGSAQTTPTAMSRLSRTSRTPDRVIPGPPTRHTVSRLLCQLGGALLPEDSRGTRDAGLSFSAIRTPSSNPKPAEAETDAFATRDRTAESRYELPSGFVSAKARSRDTNGREQIAFTGQGWIIAAFVTMPRTYRWFFRRTWNTRRITPDKRGRRPPSPSGLQPCWRPPRAFEAPAPHMTLSLRAKRTATPRLPCSLRSVRTIVPVPSRRVSVRE